MSERPRIEIDEDDYEALHLTALVFGDRIGRGDFDWPDGSPCCITGHALAADDGKLHERVFLNHGSGVGITLNDSIIKPGEEITFAEFCRRANLHAKRA